MRKTVREELLYSYARLIADARFDPGEVLGLHVYPEGYWPFVIQCYRRLLGGRMARSSATRQNMRAALAVDHCAYCGSTDRLQWDHLIPRARGGPDDFDNLVRACAACNRSKAVQPVSDWAKASGRPLPRWIRGKLLKLIYSAHEAHGTLDAPLPPDWTRSTCERMAFPGDSQ